MAQSCNAGLICQESLCLDPGQAMGTSGSSLDATTGRNNGTEAATAAPDVTGDAALTTTDGGGYTGCSGKSLRLATYNVKSVGTQESDEWNALGEVLRRIDADVVCIQEVGDFETPALRTLATALGYGEPIHANESPAIGGSLHNACIGRVPMSRVASYSGRDLDPDGDANDVGRNILVVEADLGEQCSVDIMAVHAKSGQEDIDRFRRQVEVLRIAQARAKIRSERGNNPLALIGDFNARPDDSMLGQRFDSLPPGLPSSYRLGADIDFPVAYQPFDTLEGAGLQRAEPTQEDSTATGTWGVSSDFSGIRLDYMWLDGLRVEGSLVYVSCLDDGVDAPPAGAWLPFAHEPLACSISPKASDHSPVVADLILESR